MKQDLLLTSNLTGNHNLQNISSDSSSLILGFTFACIGQNAEFLTAKPISWIHPELSPLTSYADVQSELGNIGIFSLIPGSRDTYIVSLAETSLTVQTAMHAVANALEHHTLFSPKILD